MRTIKVRVTLNAGFATAIRKDILFVQVADDATEEQIEKQIEEETEDWALEKIEYWHERIEE